MSQNDLSWAEGVSLLQLGDFLLHGVGWLVEGDDHHITAARISLDRHLGAAQSVVFFHI